MLVVTIISLYIFFFFFFFAVLFWMILLLIFATKFLLLNILLTETEHIHKQFKKNKTADCSSLQILMSRNDFPWERLCDQRWALTQPLLRIELLFFLWTPKTSLIFNVQKYKYFKMTLNNIIMHTSLLNVLPAEFG